MSSKKTYLGLSFASLMTKDIVVPKSWVLTGAGNPGDMKGFNEQWFGFKKTYRDRFLYSHIIRKMGSDVSGNGTHFEINDADEKTWNQTNIPGYSSKIDSKIGFPSANDLAHLDMQAKFGADWQ
ncbi:MAG: hypothetical protein KAH01_07665, partial [Caldisericia bacterium]|nr:hypothetical protein [Caldisericia bacterium]